MSDATCSPGLCHLVRGEQNEIRNKISFLEKKIGSLITRIVELEKVNGLLAEKLNVPTVSDT